MCTASWIITPTRYDLFFNRDELKTRQLAELPKQKTLNGVSYLAPRDRDAGGSWLIVNSWGLTIGLLNQHDTLSRQMPSAAYKSRGLLVSDLADSQTFDDIYTRLQGQDLACYQPFTLFALETGRKVSCWSWNGRELSGNNLPGSKTFISSSSYKPEAVITERNRIFNTMLKKANGQNTEFLQQFHLQRSPLGDAYSVLMNREDASTMSLAHIAMTETGVARYSYRNVVNGTPGQEFVVEIKLLTKIKAINSKVSHGQ